VADCSLGSDGGGGCSVIPFRGALDEGRLDNDANHPRDWGASVGTGVDMGPAGSGAVSAATGSGIDVASVLFVGEGGCTCTCTGCGSSVDGAVRTENRDRTRLHDGHFPARSTHKKREDERESERVAYRRGLEVLGPQRLLARDLGG
jgi:hypothetical protein